MTTRDRLQKVALIFRDPALCEEFLQGLRWKGGRAVCPACGSDRIGAIATRHLLRCRSCRKQFNSIQGTIFEGSRLGLNKWLVCVFAVANGIRITNKDLAGVLGVTLATAWRMRQRIRCTQRLA